VAADTATKFGLPAGTAKLQRFIEQRCALGESSVFGADGQFDGARLSEVGITVGTTPAEIDSARANLSALLQPASIDMASKKLMELRAVTVHRARDGIDVELMATAYTQRLARYPADVVAAACDAWADREEFWPSWAELKAECDKRMRGRLALKRALEAV
jgi:hypothetical protein